MTLKASEAKDHEKKRKWTENRRHSKYNIAHIKLWKKNTTNKLVATTNLKYYNKSKKKDEEITITKK